MLAYENQYEIKTKLAIFLLDNSYNNLSEILNLRNLYAITLLLLANPERVWNNITE